MNFVRDDFASIHRRKNLAAWLGTLRGPRKLSKESEEAIDAIIDYLDRPNERQKRSIRQDR